MSSKGFGSSLFGALVAVMVLATIAFAMGQMKLHDLARPVPGVDVLDPSNDAWSTVAEASGRPEAQWATVAPEPPGERLSVMAFPDGTAVALPQRSLAEPNPRPIVHWFDGQRWRPVTEVDEGFQVPQATRAVDGRVVIVEGPVCLVFDPARDEVTAIDPPADGVWGATLVRAGQRVYAVFEAESDHRVEVLEPGTRTWEPLPSSPRQRSAALVGGTTDGALVIEGGMETGRFLRAEGVAWMVGLGVAGLGVVLLCLRAIARGVRWSAVVIGGLLGMVVSSVGLLWLWAMSMGGGHGRPLRLGARAWRGRVSAGASRAAGSGLPWGTRRVLARAWARDAALEHASVAAFEHLAARLEAVGAPHELVARARRAAEEEAEHTRLCLALAERHAGRTLVLAPWPALPRPPALAPGERGAELARLATESFVDGTLGEGWAAAAAARALVETTDPAARRALEVIARDEASHAVHAADVVAFCVAEGGEPVRRAVARAAARERRRVCSRGLPVRRSTDVLARHGRFREARAGALDAELRARS